MSADAARARSDVPIAPVPAAEPAAATLFVPTSPEWMLDPSIPIEVRTLVDILFRLSFREAMQRHDSYRTFGTTPVSVATSYDELGAITGWNRTRLAETIKAAQNYKVLKLTGSNRTGMRYHILVSMRTYVPPPDRERAKPLFAGEHQVKKRQRTQLGLGETEVLSPAAGPNISPTDETLSPAVRLDPASFSPAPGPKDATLSPAAESKSEILSPSAGPKNRVAKERMRDQGSTQGPISQDNNRGAAPDLPQSLIDDLLLLGKKYDESLQPGNLAFLSTISLIARNIELRFPGDAVTVLDRLTRDQRVTSARNPLGLLTAGTREPTADRPTDGFLLTTTAVKPKAESPEDLFSELAPGLQSQLLDAIEDRKATLSWCRERDIPPGALEFGRRKVEQRQSNESVENEVLARQDAWLSKCPIDLRRAIETAQFSPMTLGMLRTCEITEVEDQIVIVAPFATVTERLQEHVITVLTKQMDRVIKVDTSSRPK